MKRFRWGGGTTRILLSLAVGSFILLLIATLKLQLYPLIVASGCGVGVFTMWSVMRGILGLEDKETEGDKVNK